MARKVFPTIVSQTWPDVVRVGVAALAGAVGLALLSLRLRDEPALDFVINLAAARRLLAGLPLYDLMQLASYPYSGYIGPPTTALLFVPLAGLPDDLALAVWRCCSLLCFVLALLLAARLVAPHARGRAALAGWCFVCLSSATRETLALGQLDGILALALAIAMVASCRRWWALAGAAAALATLLKVSPVVVLAFVLLRGRWRAGAGAATVLGTLSGLSLALAGAQPWVVFARQVLPVLGGGTLYLYNQSLPAFLARLASDGRLLVVVGAPLGAWRFVGPVCGAAGLAWIAWRARKRPVIAGDVAALIVVALLAGPITWYHYAAWALVAGVVLSGSVVARSYLLVGLLLALVPPLYWSPAVLDALPIRLLTGTTMVGLLAWLLGMLRLDGIADA